MDLPCIIVLSGTVVQPRFQRGIHCRDSDDYMVLASCFKEGNGMVFIEICILVGEIVALILTSIETGWRQFYYYTKKAKHVTAGDSYGSASKKEKEYTYRVQEPRLGETKILLTSTVNKSEKILYLSKNRKALRDKESNQTYKLLEEMASDS